jgi:hypothetical protein
MNDDPIDFSGLDPLNDAAEFERAVYKITAAAAPELARRRLQGSVWWQVAAWRKPVFGAGLAMLILMIGLAQFTSLLDDGDVAADDLSVALGVPDVMTDWVATDTIPTTAQVLFPGGEE